MSKNYFNGTPTSVVQYGFGRQQLQSYDGVISGSQNQYDITLDTLEKQLSDLDTRMLSIEEDLEGIDIEAGTITVANLIANNLTATNATITNDYITASSVSGAVTMNAKPIYLHGVSIADSIIGSNYGGIPFTDIRGTKGGALCSYQEGAPDGGRRACLDWGSGRIRSQRTFQAGRNTTNAIGGTVYFDVSAPFVNVPTVVVTSECDAGTPDNIHTVIVTSITTTQFVYKKKEIDIIGDISDSSNVPFNWIAFDPTNTSIF
jgi:hypothetical protein